MYHWIKSTCITESGLHVSLNQGYMYHWIRSTCITESGLHLPLHQVYMCCCFRYKTCNDFSTQIFNCWDRGCRGVKLWLNCWMGEKKKKRFDKVCTKGKNCWVTQALVLARFSPISWSEDLFFFFFFFVTVKKKNNKIIKKTGVGKWLHSLPSHPSLGKPQTPNIRLQHPLSKHCHDWLCYRSPKTVS